MKNKQDPKAGGCVRGDTRDRETGLKVLKKSKIS